MGPFPTKISQKFPQGGLVDHDASQLGQGWAKVRVAGCGVIAARDAAALRRPRVAQPIHCLAVDVLADATGEELVFEDGITHDHGVGAQAGVVTPQPLADLLAYTRRACVGALSVVLQHRQARGVPHTHEVWTEVCDGIQR